MSRQQVGGLFRIASAAAIGALVWILLAHMLREPRVIRAGEKAPDFAITTRNGSPITLKSVRGRVLVLNFWASWCAPCIAETPSLNEFQNALRQSGVIVLGISVDDDEPAYEHFLSRFKLSFETGRDPGRRISSTYGTFQIPETYIIDKSGKIAAKIISSHNWMDSQTIQLVKSLL
jgi:cytochrome c biogenesis protein CcmG/thiol:disulfide interchange protein DsbE